jgi:ABC transporter substrate binding protein
MKRREFIAGFGVAATWPLVVRAQQPTGRVYRVGYLVISSREHQLHLSNAFEEGLRSLGYRVGENVAIEYRFANGEMERLPALAADLVRLGVDVIVTGNTPNTVAAMKATTTIPIVMTNSADPVSAGLVASLVFDLSVWDVDCHNLSHHVPEEFSDVTRYCENLVREFDEGGIVGDGVARGVVISDVGIDKAMDASRNDEFGSVIKRVEYHVGQIKIPRLRVGKSLEIFLDEIVFV